ncbi:MAG: fibronectin type III domain-containing protein [Lactococcus lactis]|nr:fibronectin type III domain-containing protein [Lactococcus lactis]
MSMDVMLTSWNLPAGTTIPEFWLGQRYFGGSGKRICSIDLPKDPSKMLNQWIRITQTSTIPPYDDPSVGTQAIVTVGFFGPSEGSITFRVRKPKQEPGSIDTPYIQSASEVTTADWPKFVGTYVDTNQTSSTEPSKYDWDEMKYRVYLDGTPVGGSKLLSFDLENLKAGTSYNVQVSQINGNVESDKSESVAFKTTLTK